MIFLLQNRTQLENLAIPAYCDLELRMLINKQFRGNFPISFNF